MAVKWLDDPEDHDYEAAADYLSLISEPEAITATVDALKSAQTSQRKAKDVLRAARLELLPATNPPRQDRPREDRRGQEALAGAPGTRQGARRRGAADRRRLPPGLRQLPDRREHPPSHAVWCPGRPPRADVTPIGFGTLALIVVAAMVGPLLASVPPVASSRRGRRASGRNRVGQDGFGLLDHTDPTFELLANVGFAW